MTVWPALVLCAALALPTPGRAQGDPIPRDFDGVMTALETALATGDTEAPFVMLNRAIRTARAEGRLTPDWAIFFAMLADFVRNDRGNPAFALSLTQEGMTLVAGHPDLADFAAALQVSGAYALADLGRMDEAVAQAQLAMPLFSDYFGADDAAELQGYMAQWAQGDLGNFNTSAIEWAMAALDKARAQADQGAFGRSIAIAAQAILPNTGNLPVSDVRLINARAEMIMGQGLMQLNRQQDAANAFFRAVNVLADGGWPTPRGTAKFEPGRL